MFCPMFKKSAVPFKATLFALMTFAPSQAAADEVRYTICATVPDEVDFGSGDTVSVQFWGGGATWTNKVSLGTFKRGTFHCTKFSIADMGEDIREVYQMIIALDGNDDVCFNEIEYVRYVGNRFTHRFQFPGDASTVCLGDDFPGAVRSLKLYEPQSY